jgi:hypothetical protein
VNEKLPGKALDNYLPICLINHLVGENIGRYSLYRTNPMAGTGSLTFSFAHSLLFCDSSALTRPP